ncbi:MAG: aromatic ring-hydroxylating dioxygenase subunit alpha, partial [Actinomycetota bacterium]
MDTELKAQALRYTPKPTLPGTDFRSPAVWKAEHDKIFCATWFCVGREEEVPKPGDYLVREVGEESVIIVRNKQGELRAFYNTCAHRGTRLCDDAGSLKSGVIVCPYHAWTYDADGKLLGTPNVHEEEGFDRSEHPLFKIRIDSWMGFVFVNMNDDGPGLLETLDADPDNPRQFERWHVEALHSGHSVTYEVDANWKILLENYNECLHCPSVHPELIQAIPIYKQGTVEQRADWVGNSLAQGNTTLTASGTSNRPPLPGLTDEDIHTYYGFLVFPNLMLNMHSDCVMYYLALPRSTGHTTIVSDFLFEPSTMQRGDFDPSDITDFWDIVSLQDWAICERA